MRFSPFRLLPFLVASLLVLPSSAQTEAAPREASFGSAAEITAVDLLVDFTQNLEKKDISVIVDGKPRPIVDLDGNVGDQAASPEPWHVVLYLDALLHDDKELQWAAKLWASSLDELLALGRVELVIADPEPRLVQSGDQDQDQLAAAIARLGLEASGERWLARNRERLLNADQTEGSEETPSPEDLLAEEAGLVQHRLETLLLHLTSMPSDTSRKLVLWAGGAFSLHPQTFYQPEPATVLSLDQAGPSLEQPGSPFEQAAIDTARTLSAYGWIVLPMARPLPENRAGIKPGLRIGKLRFTLGSDLALPGFSVAFEEERDAEKADAHVALAEVLAHQGKAEEAIAELQTALHHYYGDPRTADRQALAYTRMGDLLTEIDKEEWARRAYEAARELTRGDPDSKKKKILAPPPPPSEEQSELHVLADRQAGEADIDPTEAFELLAETTAGASVREARDLEVVLEALPRRRRVTFQLEGPVQARLLPLELRFEKKGLQGQAPRWTRHGTPDTLAAARARAALLGDLQSTTEELIATVDPGAGPAEAVLVVPRRGIWKESQRLRLSVARAGFDGVIHVEHHRLETPESSGGDLEPFRVPFERDPNEPFLAVVLEDLATGRWAVRLIDED